jgi:hypothetical protein
MAFSPSPIRHLDKAEPARLAGVVIDHNLDPVHRSEWREKLTKRVFRGVETEIPNIDVSRDLPLSKLSESGLASAGKVGSFAPL